jgi:hypothetical protein
MIAKSWALALILHGATYRRIAVETRRYITGLARMDAHGSVWQGGGD